MGSFVLDADETRSTTDCQIQRVVHIEAAADCQGRSSTSGTWLPCRSSGTARYSYALELFGGSEKRRGSGELIGDIRAFLEFPAGLIAAPMRSGYQFTVFQPVAGSYEGERAGQPISGTDQRTLQANVFFSDSTAPIGGTRIAFDSDQVPSIEGPDCMVYGIVTPVAGHRHLKFDVRTALEQAKTRPRNEVKRPAGWGHVPSAASTVRM